MLKLIPGPSKSWINRFLVLACFARGTSTLRGYSSCDDVLAMRRAIEALGHLVMETPDGLQVTPGAWATDPLIDSGDAGTVARFLLPVLAWRGSGRLAMSPALDRRPMAEGLETIRIAGGRVERTGGLWVARAPMTSSRYLCTHVDTSQFLSGFMMLAAGTGGAIETSAPMEGYNAMTAELISLFGAKFCEESLANCGARSSSESMRLLSFDGRLSGSKLTADVDLSAASAYLCALAFAGVQAEVQGWSRGGQHPEKALPSLLAESGLDVGLQGENMVLKGGAFTSISLDARTLPDAVPSLAALAVRGTRPSRFHHATYLRAKETDRLAGLIQLLRAAGASTELEGATLVVHPSVLKECVLMPEEDHRMVMAALILSLAGPHVKVGRTKGLSKSDPGFEAVIERIRNAV